MKFYDRLGTVPLDLFWEAVRARRAYLDQPDTAPFAPGTLKVLGVDVVVEGLRLQTLAMAPVCACSDPDCGLVVSHIAIERSWQGEGRPLSEHHANVYGVNARGEEVLFTHDHTLARALGGDDSLANTTPMCLPCNARKARAEVRELIQRRQAAGLHPHTGQPLDAAEDLREDAPRVLKAQAHLALVAEAHGMSPGVYRAHCETQVATLHHVDHPAWTSDARLASALGLSQAALSVFKRDKRAYHLAQWAQANPPDALLIHLKQTARAHRISVARLRSQMETAAASAIRTTPASPKHEAQAQRLGLSAAGLDAFRRLHPRPRP